MENEREHYKRISKPKPYQQKLADNKQGMCSAPPLCAEMKVLNTYFIIKKCESSANNWIESERIIVMYVRPSSYYVCYPFCCSICIIRWFRRKIEEKYKKRIKQIYSILFIFLFCGGATKYLKNNNMIIIRSADGQRCMYKMWPHYCVTDKWITFALRCLKQC